MISDQQLVAFLLELENSSDAVRREPSLEAAEGCGCRTPGPARTHGSTACWLLGMLLVGVMRHKRLAARVRPTYW